MRLYVAATFDLLRAYRDAGAIPATAERIVASDASEEAEYLALMSAADIAVSAGADRRVVLVAEQESEAGAIAWANLVAIHADAQPFTDPDDEPGWYGVQEVDDLLAGG